jgi:hypothetical protein
LVVAKPLYIFSYIPVSENIPSIVDLPKQFSCHINQLYYLPDSAWHENRWMMSMYSGQQQQQQAIACKARVAAEITFGPTVVYI